MEGGKGLSFPMVAMDLWYSYLPLPMVAMDLRYSYLPLPSGHIIKMQLNEAVSVCKYVGLEKLHLQAPRELLLAILEPLKIICHKSSLAGEVPDGKKKGI